MPARAFGTWRCQLQYCHYLHSHHWQDTHLEAPEEFPKKAKLFFAHAAEEWNAEFYSKVNDDVYVNIGQYYHVLDGLIFQFAFVCLSFIHFWPDALGATLATHLDKPRVYMGCMKSGEVFSEP